MKIFHTKKLIHSETTYKLCSGTPSNISRLPLLLLIALIGTISTDCEVEAAALDCEGKINIVEKTVCSHEKLRVADKIMNDIYLTLRKTGNLSAEESMRQRKWLKDVREPCQDNDQCIFDAYSIRTEELAAITNQNSTNGLPFKDKLQISGLIEGRIRTPNWLEGGRPTSSEIFKSTDDKFYAKSYFDIPANGKTFQVESSYFDLQTRYPFIANSLKSNFQELKALPECNTQTKLNPAINGEWGCLAQTYKKIDRKAPSKSEVDDCPVRSDALVLVRWTADGLKRYRLVISNQYPKVYVNSMCTFLGDDYRVYSERLYYEPQSAQLYDLNASEIGLLVDNSFFRFNKNSDKSEYEGIRLVNEEQLENIKLKAWSKVDKALAKRMQIIAYESILDKELSLLFKKVNFEEK